MLNRLNSDILKAAALTSALTLCATASFAEGESVTLAENGDGVTFINVMVPNEGVTVEQLAEQLTLAMETEITQFAGFRSASVHISRDNTVVVNYAQWDDEASVGAVVESLQSAQLPELAAAFTMSQPEFHPYDVFSITKPGE